MTLGRRCLARLLAEKSAGTLTQGRIVEIIDEEAAKATTPPTDQPLPTFPTTKEVRTKIPPTPEDVTAYAAVIGYTKNGKPFNGHEFCDRYAANGWMVGRTRMKDWQAALRLWQRKDLETDTTTSQQTTQAPTRTRDYSRV